MNAMYSIKPPSYTTQEPGTAEQIIPLNMQIYSDETDDNERHAINDVINEDERHANPINDVIYEGERHAISINDVIYECERHAIPINDVIYESERHAIPINNVIYDGERNIIAINESRRSLCIQMSNILIDHTDKQDVKVAETKPEETNKYCDPVNNSTADGQNQPANNIPYVEDNIDTTHVTNPDSQMSNVFSKSLSMQSYQSTLFLGRPSSVLIKTN